MDFGKKKSMFKEGGAAKKDRLDVKARRRGFWHCRLCAVGRLVVLVIGLGWMGWKGVRATVDAFLLKNDAFALRHFELRTDGRLSREQVLRWTGVQPGENMWALDLAQIKRNLEMASVVRTAVVERIIPDRLRVRIWERRPVFKAYFLSPDKERKGRMTLKPYMIDSSGFVFLPRAGESEELERESFWQRLPELTGISGLRLIPGERARSGQVGFAIQTLAAFRASSMADRIQIRSIDVSKRQALVIKTSDRQEVTLGRGEIVLDAARREKKLATQFRRWEVMLNKARRENMRLISLDLSVKNNHPFQWERRTRDIPQEEPQPQISKRTET